MALNIEVTKNGKPLVLYKNNKYRESYAVKSGEIVWRCLGRSCAATVRTDAARTAITASSNQHSGPHPVTQRSLTSPRPTPSTLATTTSPMPATRDHAPSHAASSPSTSFSLDSLLTTPITDETDLMKENTRLKREIAELTEQLECVLNHSIESDTRLLNFTDQVFLANTSPLDTTTQAPRTRTDCGAQCDTPTTCENKECVENKHLVTSLRTTIEVLEADLQCLRTELRDCECGNNVRDSGWTIHSSNRHNPIKLKNKFQLLNTCDKNATPTNYEQQKWVGDRNCFKNKSKNKPKQPRPTMLPLLKSVCIRGDGHSRDLVGLVRGMVDDDAMIMGTCKPGKKFLDVATEELPPPGSCCVIIAGTNDLAAGQQRNIYQHLERRITTYLQSASVVVSTLPHRHDLPYYHPINLETERVNAYIEELGVRHPGVEVMDFNRIRRSAFSTHGMHLRPRFIQLMARLVVECLQKVALGGGSKPPPRGTASTPQSPAPRAARASLLHPRLPSDSRPITLPYDSFSDALKKQAVNQSVFLGNPHLASNQN